jgi:hypothetical protein
LEHQNLTNGLTLKDTTMIKKKSHIKEWSNETLEFIMRQYYDVYHSATTDKVATLELLIECASELKKRVINHQA